MDFKIFLLLLLVLSTVDHIIAGRSRSGSSRSRGRGSGGYGSSGRHTSSGGHTSSGSHTTSSGSHGSSSSGGLGTSNHGSTSTGGLGTSNHGASSSGGWGSGNHGTSSGGGWGTNSQGTSSTSHGTSFGQPNSVGHGVSSPGHGSSTGTHNVGSQNKDVNTIFLHGEGGGATRPAQPKNPQSPHGGLYPSAPPLSSIPSTGGKSGITTESKQTSPYNPSAPPMDYNSKVLADSYHNQAPTSFGQPKAPYGSGYGTPGQPNTAWGNPHLSNQPIMPGQQPSIGFKDHISPQTSHGVNPPYPTTHGSPPYPTTHGNPPYPTTHGNPPYPTTHGNPPYPTTHGNPPYPTTHGNPSYPTTHGSQPYPSYGGHSSYPSGSYNPPPIGGQGFGQSGYPHPPYSGSAYHPSQVPLGNPYSMHPSGAAYSTGQAHYPQQPQVLAQPASQPFVPGQTIIMVPGQQQQSSGRGFGQMLTEALVYSTVNAGVNRLINPHHHYTDSRPAASSSNTETHITYNNQYFNGLPVGNGTSFPAGGSPPVGGSFPAGGSPPVGGSFPAGGSYPVGGNYPTGGSSANGLYNPSAPNSVNNGMVPTNTIGTPNNGATVFTPGAGTGTTATSNGAGGSASGANVSNNQSNINSNPNANMPQYRISDDDLIKISEELFAKNTFNASKYIRLNLQNRTTSPNVTDLAKGPLMYVEPELLEYPSIYVTRALYDNYEHDSRKKENRTLEKRQEENLLLDTFLNTNVMSTAMQWLANRGFIDPDDFERKDVLRHIWFNVFDGTTSGFERVFTSENYGDAGILGIQDWTYFEHQESLKRIDYMGYVEKVNLGSTASLLKLNFQMDGVVRPNATIFVGTLPELHMSLYTICFYARPNNLCPVSLGGTKFNIFTHSFRYFGNDLIDLALPMI